MLGARIAALRRQAGLSQTGLARQLKISPSAVGMYEQGRREPSLQTVIALAELFGVTTDYLLTGRISREERGLLDAVLQQALTRTDRRLSRRRDRPFTLQELAVLFAAVLDFPGEHPV